MKPFLINLYKVYYSFGNSRYPDEEPTALGDFSASGVVFLFICVALLNIYLPLQLIWGITPGKIDKPTSWLFLLIGYYLVYLLLFKVWKLESRSYCLPEYKPDRQTIRKTWTIVFINAGILVIMGILHFTLRKD